MSIIDEKTLINEYVTALRLGRASIFVGAGMSYDEIGVDWDNLIKPYAQELGIVSTDYPFVAQAYVNRHNNADAFKREICEKFKHGEPSAFHKLIARLSIRNYWTTNYDKLIEKALITKKFDVISCNDDFSQINAKKRDHIIYKCHGDCDKPESIVIAQADYEAYGKNSYNFTTALSSELATSTILFVGYSFRDQDINHILAQLSVVNNNNTLHYFITKKETGDKQAEQTYWINNLERYGIKTCLIDDYSHILKIMRNIEKKYMANQVFISGSALSYRQFGTAAQAQDFIRRLGYRLVENDCSGSNEGHGLKIINGNGFGVGSYLADGIAKATAKYGLDMADYYQPYTFDQEYYSQFEKEKTIEEQYRAYREKMIDKCGIAFFMFGNKRNPATNKIVNADGVRKEFEIAKAKHKYVFPIGATGYIAKDLADETIANFEKYNGDMPYVKDIYLRMNKSGISAEEIINCMIQIIDTLAYRDDIK